MAGVLELIWVGGEAEYFCKWGWTAKRLICPAGANPASAVSHVLNSSFRSALKRELRCAIAHRKIHNHEPGVWIPDSRYATSGMTRLVICWAGAKLRLRSAVTHPHFLFRGARSANPMQLHIGESIWTSYSVSSV